MGSTPTRALVLLLACLWSCRSNPFGDTDKPLEEFTVYTTDFAALNDGGARAALLEVIGGAKTKLDCAFSALTSGDVIAALLARTRAGIHLRIAFDADAMDSDPGSRALTASGVTLFYGNAGNGVMRHNFCLADERHIYVSTAPPEDTAMLRTPNIAFKIMSPQFGIARDFAREMNLLSELAFGNAKAKTDFTTAFTILDQVIGAYWGPQEDPLNVLARGLAEAQERVDFYSTAFQTTSSKADSDVPRILAQLEQINGISVQKIFSTQALFDPDSKAYMLANPRHYANPSVSAGAQIFVVDRGLNSAKTYVYTGALRSEANSADDSVLLEFSGKYAAGIAGAYLDRIGAVSAAVSNVGDTSAAGAVVVSEIHWMGSYTNTLTGDTGDEFIELYNTTPVAVNISGWKFACTTNAGFTVNSYVTFPPGAAIAGGGYFVLASKSSGAFQNANYYDPNVAVTNSSHECKLTNGKAEIPGTYAGRPDFTGTTIDTVGNGVNAFDSLANMGTNDSSNKIRRSMERINTAALGTDANNWRLNSFSVSQNIYVGIDFRNQTYASPGSASNGAVISLINPSFETAGAWTNLTAGTLQFDSAVAAFQGSNVAHYNTITTSTGGREIISECLAAAPLTHYTASIREFAPAINISSVSSGIKLWWFADTACAATLSQSTQSQSTVAPANSWNLRTYAQTSPPGALSLRVSFRPRRATSAECGACANAADNVYYDAAAVATP